MSLVLAAPIQRRSSLAVFVGHVGIGGTHPIRIQSMTNTDTEDAMETAEQIVALAQAGSELVRITVNTERAAEQVPYIRDEIRRQHCDVPLIGDFHYNGHVLLTKYPACAEALDKYRINPGNVGHGAKHDERFSLMIEQAIRYDKAVRIGVNWGSLDQDLLTQMMNDNAKHSEPLSVAAVTREALIVSALQSAELAVKLGLSKDKMILSCKVSGVQDLISLYRDLATRCDYPLHVGLTEAGMGLKGTVATSAAFAVLLQEGIGDTIRCSLTPEPGASRTQEVIICQQILQTMGLRLFTPMVAACPGCGRTKSTYFQELARSIEQYVRLRMSFWREHYSGVEGLTLAVMGCVVNGPGESKQANIGISLPGTGEEPVAPVFIDGKKAVTLRGDDIAEQFQQLVEDYVATHYVRANCQQTLV